MYCRQCGLYLGETATTCGRCGWAYGQQSPSAGAMPPPRQDIGQDAGMRLLLPVGRSGWAIAAGYAGLFAFIVFPAPLALLFGIIAVQDIKKHPEKHGMGRAVFGIVAGAIGTLILVAGALAIMMHPGRF
jgi:Domain of unknown function (DUF4190)